MTLFAYLINTAFQVFEDLFLPRLLALWVKIEPHYQTWKRIAIGLVVAFNICCFSLCISAFLFGTIYFYHMPTVYNTFPLDFHYNRNCIQYHKAFERDCDHKGDRIYNEKCFPVATTQLSSPDHPKLLQEAQLYTVIVKLTLPETPRNLDIGMFMIHMRVEGRNMNTKIATKTQKIKKNVNSYFTDSEPVIIFKSSKATSIRYVSFAIRMITTALFWPFFLADFWQETQTVNEIIFDEILLEKKYYNWTGIVHLDHPGIDLYHAEMDVVAKFTGIQYYLYRWPIISFILGTGVFFLPVLINVLVFLYFCIWKPFIASSLNLEDESLNHSLRRGRRRGRRASLEENDDNNDPSNDDENLSSSSNTVINATTPVETLPTNPTSSFDPPTSSRRSSCSSSSIEMIPSRSSVSQMSYVVTPSTSGQVNPEDIQQQLEKDDNKENCDPNNENAQVGTDENVFQNDEENVDNSQVQMRRRIIN